MLAGKVTLQRRQGRPTLPLCAVLQRTGSNSTVLPSVKQRSKISQKQPKRRLPCFNLRQVHCIHNILGKLLAAQWRLNLTISNFGSE
jgi:hypothetical protein